MHDTRNERKLQHGTKMGQWYLLGYARNQDKCWSVPTNGTLKARSIRRKGSKEDRWDWKEFKDMQGLPWEPIPGQGDREVKARIHIPEDPIQPAPEGMIKY